MFRMPAVIVAATLLSGGMLLAAPVAASGAAVHRASPAAASDDATLTGVTCSSTSSCLTAGFFVATAENAVFGLSEEWDGHAWGTLTVSGLTTKAAVTDALEVSCGTPPNCMIVGEHFSNPRLPVQFADTLNGVWSPVKWNNPAGARWSVLDDVKCVGTNFCMAIGISSRTAGGGRALAELWNGSSWQLLAAPNPARVTSSDLSALSCVSATDCQAVGVAKNSAGHTFDFAEHWNGSTWTLAKVPNVRGRGNALNDVTCFASGECIAVGFTRASRINHPLVLRLHAGAWRIIGTPALRNASLAGVSCPSATLCVAVGNAGTGPLTEKWNGSKWAVLKTARTGGTHPDDSLQHVACVSISHCVAVGFRYNVRRRSSNHTLIESWNGASWRVQTSVNP